MPFDLTRLSGDPAYAPCKIPSGRYFYWRAPRSYIAMGHVSDAIRLPGEKGDGRDLERAAKCRDLTRELLRWVDSLDQPKIEPGTWKHLIQRYRTDEFSPYQDVKANTRADYDYSLNRWIEAIGDVTLAETDHVAIMRWKKAMEAKGRSLHYIRSMFTKLRLVVGFGVMIKAPGAVDVRDVLSAMKFRSAPARDVAPTYEQVQAIIAQADLAGYDGFALGLCLQWHLMLRANDVRGQVLNGQWQDGMIWNMLDGTILRKVPSKTAKTTGRAMTWDLSLVPEVMARIDALPLDQRVGPMIRQKNGQPFTKRRWAALFRHFAVKAGVPDDVRCMDLRAGAITEAKNLGASITDLQNAATHASVTTTERYMRDREGAGNKVIEIRRAK